MPQECNRSRALSLEYDDPDLLNADPTCGTSPGEDSLSGRKSAKEREMADQVIQNFQNHRKYVPLFHFVTLGILTVNLLWSAFRLFMGNGLPFFDRLLNVVVAFALALLAFYARTFALGAQDRVIRLEERLRLARILPADLQPRINDLSRGQLIALRFAGDAETADLVRKILAENITRQDDIKKLIKDWKIDHFRL